MGPTRTLLAAALLLGACTPDVLDPEPPLEPVGPAAWAPPAWYPATGHAGLAAIQALDGHGPTGGGPVLHAKAAIVVDLHRGAVLLERNADAPRAVASVTKLFAALAAASAAPDWRAPFCVTPEHWPTRRGAVSRFETGTCYTGWDALGAALVRSDNRGAMALPTVAGLPYDPFVARMNEVAAELGATSSTFTDPAGLEDENRSTARDVLRAAIAVAFHPDLALPASAPVWHIATGDGARVHDLPSTNPLADRADVHTLAAKTGYTHPAGFCWAGVVETAGGARLAIAVLGAGTPGQRAQDLDRLLSWYGDPAPTPGLVSE